jgi:hypothetical protein
MATKAEVKAIEKEIAEHREHEPEMANGLILALAILNDEHEPKYIPITKPELQPGPITWVADDPVAPVIKGSFAYALNEMENNGNQVHQTGLKDSVLSFEKGKFYSTSPIRGRELLKEFPFSMVNAKNWVIYEPS